MNPNTLTAPLFRARADLDLTRKLYQGSACLDPGASPGIKLMAMSNPWGITFQQGLYNMTSASSFFRTTAQLTELRFNRDGRELAA